MSKQLSLREQVAARKLAKRERLQEERAKGAKGKGRQRLFGFKPLEFESNPEQFDVCGGEGARQLLVQEVYKRPSGDDVMCLQLVAPKDFRFAYNLDGVLRFVYELRRQAFIERKFISISSGEMPFFINLDYIEYIDLRGALVLAAEIDRIRRVIGFRPFLDDRLWRSGIRSLLYALGIHEIIQAKAGVGSVFSSGNPLVTGFANDDVQIIKMRSGQSSSNELALEIREELFDACRPFSAARPQIYNVLVEAFNNSREHAYPNGSGEDGIPSVRGWWAGGMVNHRRGFFTLAVYDQGIGIPERFSRQHSASQQERLMVGGAGDLLVLKRAAEHGSTSSHDPGRGNGLWQMTELTREVRGSEVEFTSLRGNVTFKAGFAQNAFITPQRFGGTMIKWMIPFKDAL